MRKKLEERHRKILAEQGKAKGVLVSYTAPCRTKLIEKALERYDPEIKEKVAKRF